MSNLIQRYFWVIIPVLLIAGVVTVVRAVDDTTPPAAVANLSITSATSTSAALSWTAPGDDGAAGMAASYDLRYRTTGPIDEINFATSTPVAGEPSPHVVGTLESFIVPGLAPTTTYWFGLRSTDDAGNTSGLSNIVSTTTPADTAAPVINGVIVTDITSGSAKVKWATNEVASSLVRYGTTTGYGFTASVGGMLQNHEIPLSGLVPSTLYHFSVTSADNFGHTATSSDSTFTTLATTTPDTMPPVISGITVTDITQTSAKIRWNTNEQSHSLVRYGTTTAYGLSVLSGTLVFSHTMPLTGLLPLTSYHFAVSSADSSGNTATSSNHLFTTLASSTPATTTIQANLQMDPRTINRVRKGKKVTATVRLPKGVTFEGLDTDSVRLNDTVKPIDLKFRKNEWRWWGRSRRTLVMKFNSDDILPLIPSPAEQFTFRVKGTIKAGIFNGTDTIRVIPLPPPHDDDDDGDDDDGDDSNERIEKRMKEAEKRLEAAQDRVEKRKEEIEKRKEEAEKRLEKHQEKLNKRIEKLKERFDD